MNCWNFSGQATNLQLLRNYILTFALVACPFFAHADCSAIVGPTQTVEEAMAEDSPSSAFYSWRGVTADADNKVSAVADYTGNIADFVQATADNQPLLAVDSNGVPVLRFDGTNDGLASTATLATIFAADAKTVFIVFSTQSYATQRRLLKSSDNKIIFFSPNSASFRFYNDDGSADYALGAGLTTDTVHIFSARHEGGKIYAQLDNGAEGSATSGNTSALTGTLVLGAHSGEYFLGDLYSIVTYKTALSEAQRKKKIAALYNHILRGNCGVNSRTVLK